MQIAEAFVAIRPQVDKAQFQREITAGVTPGATVAGRAGGKAIGTGLQSGVDKGTFQQRISQAAVPGAQKAGSEAGKAFGAGMRNEVSVVRGLGILIGAASAGVFLRGAKQEIQQSIQSTAQLRAVLKATGGEAGVTEDHVVSLSTALSKQDAVDDDLIKHNAALLLSFRHVQNQMGEGNDVFDRTLKASADLAALFGGDMQGALLQLAKAVENPATGLTALQRAGVTFTAQQKDQIKTLVEHNDLLGAQKIILAEVEHQFKGTAAQIAKDDPFARFDVDFKNFQESVGRDLLPTLSAATRVGAELFHVFGLIPEPLREVGFGLVALGAGGVAVVKIATALKGLKDVFFAVAAAEEAAGAAGATAAVGMGRAASLSTVIGGLAVGLTAGALVGAQINKVFAGGRPDVDAYAKSLGNLGKTGLLSGTALDELGIHASTLAGDLRTIKGSTIEKAFGLAPSAHRAVADIKSVNDALIALAQTEGVPAAQLAYGNLVNQLLADGVKIGDIAPQFRPFLRAIDDIAPHADAAATRAQSAFDKLSALFGDGSKTADLSGRLGVDDAFQSASDALDDLNQARLDAIGKGEKSAAAADAESQAYRSLADAQRGAQDSSENLAKAQQSLADAQSKLAEFDNPTSQTIRSLERTQIVRRQVVTPADVRQKELDLLKFDQDNTDRRADLQRGVRDAVLSVRDAEQSVEEAAGRVADAQRKVGEAAEKRKQVMVDALASIEGLERKAKEQALQAGTAFAAWAEQAHPADDVLKSMLTSLQAINLEAGNPGLAKNLGDIAKSIITSQLGAEQLKATIAASLGPQGPTDVDLPQGQPRSTFDAFVRSAWMERPASEKQLTLEQWAKAHHVPGFATGGLVNFPLGKPGLIVAHGGETVLTPEQKQNISNSESFHVEQHNHYHDAAPKPEDAEWNNIMLGQLIARRGGRA